MRCKRGYGDGGGGDMLLVFSGERDTSGLATKICDCTR